MQKSSEVDEKRCLSPTSLQIKAATSYTNAVVCIQSQDLLRSVLRACLCLGAKFSDIFMKSMSFLSPWHLCISKLFECWQGGYKQSNIGGPDRSENDASPCKLMNNHGGNTFLYCSCQQLSHLGLGPSKSIWAHTAAFKGLQPMTCTLLPELQSYKDTVRCAVRCPRTL